MKIFDDMKQKSNFNKLQKGKISLKDTTEAQRDNEEFVRKAIETNGIMEFRFASERLRNDTDFIVEYANYVLKAIETNGIEEFEKVDFETSTNQDFLLVMYSKKPEVAKYFTTVFAPDQLVGGKIASSTSNSIGLAMEFAPEIFKHLPLDTARWMINTYSYSPFVDHIEDREGNLLLTPKMIMARPEDDVMAQINDILVERTVKDILQSNNPIEKICYDDFANKAYASYVAKEIDEKGLEEFEKLDEDVQSYEGFLREILKLKPEVAKYIKDVYGFDSITQDNKLVTSTSKTASLVGEFAPEIFNHLPLLIAEWILDAYTHQPFINVISNTEGHVYLQSGKAYIPTPDFETIQKIIDIVDNRKANEIEDDGIADE